MKYLLLLCALGVGFLSGCDRVGATRILQENGYRDIQITGYAWFACGHDDTYASRFKATSPSGAKIEGAVCEGLIFKNATIRFK